MNQFSQNMSTVEFIELESRFGRDNAFAILRTLEQFEGVTEAHAAKLSFEERLRNVFVLMQENMRYQTRH